MQSCRWKRQSWWIGEVMSLAGSVNGIWSEFVMSGKENTWGDGELNKKNWHFGLKGVAMANSDCDEDDWESVWTEGRFDLGMDDGGDDLINDQLWQVWWW